MLRSIMQMLLLGLASAGVSQMAPEEKQLNVYTFGPPHAVTNDLSSMTNPILDFQGLSDWFSQCQGSAFPDDWVVASFEVKVFQTVVQQPPCAGSFGNQYKVSLENECYTQDTFPEECQFRVLSVGKVGTIKSFADAGCRWRECLPADLNSALMHSKDVCENTRDDGFDADACHKCTNNSTQAASGPWYSNASSNGWSCNTLDPAPPPTGRWIPMGAMCSCSGVAGAAAAPAAAR